MFTKRKQIAEKWRNWKAEVFEPVGFVFWCVFAFFFVVVAFFLILCQFLWFYRAYLRYNFSFLRFCCHFCYWQSFLLFAKSRILWSFFSVDYFLRKCWICLHSWFFSHLDLWCWFSHKRNRWCSAWNSRFCRLRWFFDFLKGFGKVFGRISNRFEHFVDFVVVFCNSRAQ